MYFLNIPRNVVYGVTKYHDIICFLINLYFYEFVYTRFQESLKLNKYEIENSSVITKYI